MKIRSRKNQKERLLLSCGQHLAFGYLVIAKFSIKGILYSIKILKDNLDSFYRILITLVYLFTSWKKIDAYINDKIKTYLSAYQFNPCINFEVKGRRLLNVRTFVKYIFEVENNVQEKESGQGFYFNFRNALVSIFQIRL